MNVLNSWGDSPAVDEIRQFVRGPARPVLEKAALRWLKVHTQAIRKGLSPLFPYPADQSDLFSPRPKQPLPSPNVKQGCAVLAAVHDEHCHRGAALFPAPTAEIDPVGYAIWRLLRDAIREKPDASYVREILVFVRTELQKRGVLPTGESESASSTVVQGIPTSGGGRQPAAGADEWPQDGNGARKARGRRWQAVQADLERIRLAGEHFTSYDEMSQRLGCSGATVHKTIHEKGTIELQEWAAKQHGESRLNVSPEAAAVAFEGLPQGREPDPTDIMEDDEIERALTRLLSEAEKRSPELRAQAQARIDELRGSPDKLRQLAELLPDPDHEEWFSDIDA